MSDELLEYARKDLDLYALLSTEGSTVHPGSTEAEINRAWRRATLKVHPDKVQNDPEAASKFHHLSLARDVLCDEKARAAYDNARTARAAKQRQKELFSGKRKSFMEDLLQRESAGVKRKRDEQDAEEILERELKRLAADGLRRRMERERAQREQEGEEIKQQENVPVQPQQSRPSQVGELQRTIKVKWRREGTTSLDKDRLLDLFQRFGPVESCLVLKDKKKKLAGEGKKSVVATGVLVFASVVGAHAAVEDPKKRLTERECDIFLSIEWAEGKEPDFLASVSSSSSMPTNTPSQATPSTPAPTTKPRQSFPGLGSEPITPLSSFKAKAGISDDAKGPGLRKVPSFASFQSANFNSPLASPFANGSGTPSKEEITMIRLKQAEKRRLEEQIRKEEAAEAEVEVEVA
jgi:DnaJ family protein C protein 17